MTREYVYRCPGCECPQPPIPESRVTPAGWLTFWLVLVAGIVVGLVFWLAFLLVPVAFIGLSFREHFGACPQCNHESPM